MMLFLPMIDAQRTLSNLNQWFDRSLFDVRADRDRRQETMAQNYYERREDESARHKREILGIQERHQYALQHEGLGDWAQKGHQERT